MINTIIIDDEQHCIDRLTTLIGRHCADTITICGTYNNINDAKEGINRFDPNLVFLDVMLKDNTGFDLLRQLPEVTFEVIFTTAYDQFAVEAFRFSALDYLLKPVDPEELVAAVGKLNNQATLRNRPAQLSALLNNLKNEGQDKRLAIPTMRGIDFIHLHNIIRCQSEGNYTIVHLNDSQKITVAKTLKVFEELLSGYDFFRIHHSHIVNLAHVKSYAKGKVGYVIMTDGSQVEVATRRKDGFMKRMLR